MTSFQNVDFKAKIQALFLVTTLCGRYLLRETDWTSSSEAPTRTAVHTLNLFKVKENFINTKGNNRRDLLLQVAVSHTHNHKDTHIHIYKQRVQHKIVHLQTITTTTCKDILVLIWNFITLVSNTQQRVVPMKQNPSIRQPVCGLISFTSWWCTFEMRQFYCQLISVSLSTRDQYYFFMPHLNRVVLAQQRAVLVSRRWWETADWTLAPKAPQWTESHRQPVHGREHWGPPECGPSLCKSRARVIAKKDPCKVQPKPLEPINSYFIKTSNFPYGLYGDFAPHWPCCGSLQDSRALSRIFPRDLRETSWNRADSCAQRKEAFSSCHRGQWNEPLLDVKSPGSFCYWSWIIN